MVVLDIFNNIWTSGEIPECWKEATVIPIPKPGKDSKNTFRSIQGIRKFPKISRKFTKSLKF